MATFYSSYNNGYRLTVTTSYGNQNRSTMTSTVYWSASISGTSASRTANGTVNIGGDVYNIGFSTSGSTTLYHNKTTGYGNFSVSASASVWDVTAQTKYATVSLSGKTTDVPTITPYTYPTANASVSSISRNSAVLSWSSNATINYWWYSLNNGSWVAVGNPNTSSGSRSITGLSAGTAYTLKVRLRKADGNLTTDSSNASFTTSSLAVANKPALSSVTRTSMVVSFTSTASMSGWQYSINNGTSWSSKQTGSGVSATGTITGLSPGTTYNVRVRVYDGAHTGSITSQSAATAATTTAPGAAVSGLSSSNITRNSFKVSFTTTNTMNGFIYSTDDGTNWTGKYTASGTSGSFTVDNRSGGTAYNVRVRVYDHLDSSLSATSSRLVVTTQANASPNTPTLSSRTGTTATINWSSNYTVKAVEYSINGGVSWLPGQTVNATTSGSFTIPNLTAGLSYSVRVRVTDSVNTTFTSASSSPLTVTTWAGTSSTSYTSLVDASTKTLAISKSTTSMYNDVTLQMWADNQKWEDIRTWDNVTGTITYTLSASEVTFIENNRKGTVEVSIRYYVTNKWGGSGGADQGVTTSNTSIWTIPDAKPTIGAATYKDVHSNGDLISFKGGDQVILRNISPVEINLGAMTAVKGATLVKYVISTPSGPVTTVFAAGTTSSTGQVKNIGTIDSDLPREIAITVYDSRGLEETYRLMVNVMNYLPPQIISLSGDRLNGYEEITNLNLLARYTRIMVGDLDKNKITAEYRIKLSNSPSYGPLQTVNLSNIAREESDGSWQRVWAADPNPVTQELEPQFMEQISTELTATLHVEFQDEITGLINEYVEIGKGVGMVEKFENRWEFSIPLKMPVQVLVDPKNPQNDNAAGFVIVYNPTTKSLEFQFKEVVKEGIWD